jgi:ParB-like nuclease domain
MSQHITQIPVRKIKFQGGKKGLTPSVLDLLYDSISKQGLFNAIIVRPDPVSPGYYRIVQGRHRYYVVAHMLKKESIECRIFADMSEEKAELASLSENVCRTNAKPTDRLLALRKWQEVYKKYFPLLEGKKASGHSRWANSTKAESKQKAIDDEKAQDEAVRAAAAAASCEGDPTLSRDLKIDEGLTEEQIYCLNVVQCTKQNMLRIIEVTPGDVVRRGEIVTLVASGMEVELAIAEVLGTTTTKKEANGS